MDGGGRMLTSAASTSNASPLPALASPSSRFRHALERLPALHGASRIRFADIAALRERRADVRCRVMYAQRHHLYNTFDIDHHWMQLPT